MGIELLAVFLCDSLCLPYDCIVGRDAGTLGTRRVAKCL